MPDHLHLLVEECSEASDCLRFIRRAKQFSVQNPEEYPFSGSTTDTLSEVLTAIGDFTGPAKAGHYSSRRNPTTKTRRREKRKR
jgi:hypothetical protein